VASSIAICPVPAAGRTGQPGANARRRDALTRQRVAETIASSPNAARIERLVAWLKNLGQSEAGDLIDTIKANDWVPATSAPTSKSE
jgi:hypothetical protein